MSLKGKTPTFSGWKLQKKYPFQGLQISVENRKGSVREWTDRNGRSGTTKMCHDYGYIKRTLGKDGDHIDCYVGPDKDSEMVFVVHQTIGGKHDEDKIMLGFTNEKEAKEAYLKHYTNSSFWGGCTKMTVDELKEKIIGKEVKKIDKAWLKQNISKRISDAIIQKSTPEKFSMEDAKHVGDKLKLDWGKYDQHQFHMGLNVEVEHGSQNKKTDVTHDNETATAKIAIAHLDEMPDYYTKLKEMEKSRGSKKDKKKKGKSGAKKKTNVKADKQGAPKAKAKKKGKKIRNLKVSSQSGRTLPWNPKSKYTENAHNRRPPSVPKKANARPYSVTGNPDRVTHVSKKTSTPSAMIGPKETRGQKQSSSAGDTTTHAKRADNSRSKMRQRRHYMKSNLEITTDNIESYKIVFKNILRKALKIDEKSNKIAKAVEGWYTKNKLLKTREL